MLFLSRSLSLSLSLLLFHRISLSAALCFGRAVALSNSLERPKLAGGAGGARGSRGRVYSTGRGPRGSFLLRYSRAAVALGGRVTLVFALSSPPARLMLFLSDDRWRSNNSSVLAASVLAGLLDANKVYRERNKSRQQRPCGGHPEVRSYIRARREKVLRNFGDDLVFISGSESRSR